jgi:hypothetical protein
MPCREPELRRVRRRREPERGALYHVLLAHLQTFLARADERVGPGLPGFVRRELYRYLDCGILANGFARVHCASCGRDELVAFSCKGRGFCPSCCGRRMADTAMHLADEVLPAVPLRQWVLSFPYPVRFHLAYDAHLCAAVRRIFVRTLLGWLRQRGERAGITAGRSGAVVVTQRFGSALNLNLHVHALVLDGVYASPAPLTRPRFHPAEPLTDADVAQVTALLQRRILRYLARCDRLRRDTQEVESEPDEPLLAELYSASLQGRGVLAERGEQGLQRLGRRREARPLSLPGELCASLGGLSLHAKVALEADDHEGRERLARYLLRPPIASERLSLSEHGRVVYRLRRHWKDGTRAVVFAPLDFLARLAALVPRPRTHLLTYHGVLAPAAEWRDWIVPVEPRLDRADPSQALAERALRPDHARKRATWAELMKRVFEIDVLRCPWCGGKRKLIALITDGAVVRRILEHLGLPTAAPVLAPARSPPELEFAG